MSVIVFVAWSLLIVVATAGLMYFVMQSHLEVRLAKQREELAAARAKLGAEKEALESRLQTTEESSRRKAMDDFLADIRVEERHYTREHKILFMSRKMLVRQERIYFRNIPLSSWVEQEMPIEEGVDAESMAKTMSIFASAALIEEAAPQVSIRRLLQ
jgi:hypothetical protein